VDAVTGKQRWRTMRPGIVMGYGTPVIRMGRGGLLEVVTIGLPRVEAFSVATGERLWSFPFAGEAGYGLPILDGDRVIWNAYGRDAPWLPRFADALAKYDRDKDGRLSKEEFRTDQFSEYFGSFDDNHDGFVDEKEWNAARNLGVGEYGLVSIDPGEREPRLLWRSKKYFARVTSPLLYRGIIYTVRSGGIVTTVDAGTGSVLKQGRVEKAIGGYFASPVASDGKVYLADETGKVAVLRAGAEWEMLAVNDLAEEIYATPAIAGGTLHIRTRDAVYAFASR
jgi:outer membrane protein assembly factor BamB